MQQENRRTVLIADAEPTFRAGLRHVLEEELGRFEVVAEAATPAEVTRLLRSTEPELVVMDLALARTLGLRADRLGGLLPRPPKVVLLTGGGHEGLDEALDAGARGFVTRDLDAGLLGAVLCHVLADGCAIAPEVFGGLMERPSVCQAQFARAHHRVRLLNPSERHVLQLLGHGFENAQIAEELHLSRASVKTYVSRLLSKLHLDNRTQAALVANETGLAGRGGLMSILP
ncbi:response regulator transcription factor [Streptomyces sp. 5.8]|uniref:response regulator transcription factor n=1 Tax=Streptomyces sp. 5.8 TaxID=3406571 RepID=UPI003BB50604